MLIEIENWGCGLHKMARSKENQIFHKHIDVVNEIAMHAGVSSSYTKC